MLELVGGCTLFGLFALSMLLHVARWRRLRRGADALCAVQFLALCISPGWFTFRLMPIVALGYVTYCIHWGVRYEMAYRREMQRRSIRL